ncbi:hypothetical protein I6H52_08920 [Corynebacterium urealyticum]|uniref:Uncharacterized protein n=1 Tax=Corynebacterium urealyticum (strain ATCC 43042 / DSM 7109) TaxID=504474 RepID=B1VFI9_CORU7|nr:hypothetical protein [Corynebacterium urealyticum]QQC41982.1 hypothetical protein I6H51_09970 [Corynebacterium urealyticum]QQE50606.1 hypothetical protein I6H52_08920 [Corynebacterium urealyticum]CAQ04528.1 hypothetical protein cu0568 [Corynebacterium urealyticum DSM 7109]SNV95975.1 Uncharacterised protein [Corynebacterium urealyticum]
MTNQKHNPGYPPTTHNPGYPPSAHLSPATGNSSTMRILTAVLLALLALAVATALSLYYVKTKSDDLDLERAKAACIEDVEKRAKYPGGVTFPDDGPKPATANDWLDSPRTYTAEGVVDFPNGFGTPVRMEYACTADIYSDGEVESSSAQVWKQY